MSVPTLRRLALLAAASSVLALSAPAFAQATGGADKAEMTPPAANKAPEQAAVDACKGKKDGDRVRFTDAKGKKHRYGCSTVDGVTAARPGVATAAHKTKKEKAAAAASAPK